MKLARREVLLLYSFVVPTRERHDVLKSTLQAILNQTRSNFEIVVMDNASSPATKSVVDSFDSPQIRYVRSPTRLAMTDNWELALQHASGDFITYVGDDDGPLPDAIEIAEEIHQVWPNTIVTWKPIVYFWPNFFVKQYRNLVHTHVGLRVEKLSSRELLKDVYAGKKTYESLPSLYQSFAPRDLIEKVRAKFGCYFLSTSPDIASGLVNGWSSEAYVYSHRPLSVRGVSHHSTGAAYSYPELESEAAETFQKEIKGGTWDEELHKNLAGDFMVEVLIVSELLRFKEKYFLHDDDIQPDMIAILRWFCESAPRYGTRYDDAKKAIYEIARKNGIDASSLEIVPVFPSYNRAIFNSRLDEASGTLSYSYYANEFFVKNIADFTMAVAAMSVAKGDLEFREQAPQKQELPSRVRRLWWPRR